MTDDRPPRPGAPEGTAPAPTPAPAPPWRATVLTLFPEMFPGVLGHSLAGRALELGLWQLDVRDIRDGASDRHRTVDDTPFGGGPGMVLRADVLDRALRAAQGDLPATTPLIYLSPRGRRLNQALVRSLASGPGVVLLCGRYEGVDQRVLEAWQLDELSIGDYVLAGGEVAAQVVLEAVTRLLPGVMGNAQTAALESFEDGLLEHPHYTRPAQWTGPDGVVRSVPGVLQSGHHARIQAWRQAQAEALTRSRRPDLWQQWLDRSSQSG